MSTVHEDVNTALSAVLSNTWAVELPPKPTFPALMFDIETEQEEQWCANGGYDQHLVHVFILAKTMEYIDTMKPLIRAAMEAMSSFMFEDGGGDSEYEGDPKVYAFLMTFRLRTSRY